MKNSKKNLELLAPAGNMEKMKTALAFGADAVYVGIPDFSLRVRINDFDIDGIREASKYCHKKGKKIYVTINIFAHNKHLGKLPEYIETLKSIGVDALIISDPGVFSIARSIWPEAEIHLSTQANCTNWQSAKFWFESGVKRVVLGREVTLKEIREIHKRVPELELEYFAHGAMCMAYSGRCFLSKLYLDRSGNQGDCVQPCRWEHLVENRKQTTENRNYQASLDIRARGHDEILELYEEEHGSYILNSKDLCLLRYLKDLADAGVVSFKIEGRAKSIYYQAMISGIYSRVLHHLEDIREEEIDFLYQELNTKLMHRGYTDGFIHGGVADQNLANTHVECDWEFCGEVIEMTENRKQTTANREQNTDNRRQSTANKCHHLEVEESTPPPGQEEGARPVPSDDGRGWSEIKAKPRYISIKVHNSLKVGDEIEIVRPEYDILKMKVTKLIDPKNGEEISEAHGGQGLTVLLEVHEEVPLRSVLRREIPR